MPYGDEVKLRMLVQKLYLRVIDKSAVKGVLCSLYASGKADGWDIDNVRKFDRASFNALIFLLEFEIININTYIYVQIYVY